MTAAHRGVVPVVPVVIVLIVVTVVTVAIVGIVAIVSQCNKEMVAVEKERMCTCRGM